MFHLPDSFFFSSFYLLLICLYFNYLSFFSLLYLICLCFIYLTLFSLFYVLFICLCLSLCLFSRNLSGHVFIYLSLFSRHMMCYLSIPLLSPVSISLSINLFLFYQHYIFHLSRYFFIYLSM